MKSVVDEVKEGVGMKRESNQRETMANHLTRCHGLEPENATQKLSAALQGGASSSGLGRTINRTGISSSILNRYASNRLVNLSVGTSVTPPEVSTTEIKNEEERKSEIQKIVQTPPMLKSRHMTSGVADYVVFGGTTSKALDQELETADLPSNWNQFEANRSLLGSVSSFSENDYSTKLNLKDHTSEEIAQAARIEEEVLREGKKSIVNCNIVDDTVFSDVKRDARLSSDGQNTVNAMPTDSDIGNIESNNRFIQGGRNDSRQRFDQQGSQFRRGNDSFNSGSHRSNNKIYGNRGKMDNQNDMKLYKGRNDYYASQNNSKPYTTAHQNQLKEEKAKLNSINTDSQDKSSSENLNNELETLSDQNNNLSNNTTNKFYKDKNVFEKNQNILEKNVLGNDVVENFQNVRENSQNVLENSETVLESSQNVLENSQNVLENEKVRENENKSTEKKINDKLIILEDNSDKNSENLTNIEVSNRFDSYEKREKYENVESFDNIEKNESCKKLDNNEKNKSKRAVRELRDPRVSRESRENKSNKRNTQDNTEFKTHRATNKGDSPRSRAETPASDTQKHKSDTRNTHKPIDPLSPGSAHSHKSGPHHKRNMANNYGQHLNIPNSHINFRQQQFQYPGHHLVPPYAPPTSLPPYSYIPPYVEAQPQLFQPDPMHIVEHDQFRNKYTSYPRGYPDPALMGDFTGRPPHQTYIHNPYVQYSAHMDYTHVPPHMEAMARVAPLPSYSPPPFLGQSTHPTFHPHFTQNSSVPPINFKFNRNTQPFQPVLPDES